MLARRVRERRAGLLALVEGLLVADAHTLLAKLGLAELRLRLEAGWLWLHGRELLLHLGDLGHQSVLLLLLREATTITSRLSLLELLVLLLHLEFLQALARRRDLGLLITGVLRLERWWWAECRLLRVEARRGCCSGRRWHREASACGLLCGRCWSLISSLLRTQGCDLVEDSLVGSWWCRLCWGCLCGLGRSCSRRGSRCRSRCSARRLRLEWQCKKRKVVVELGLGLWRFDDGWCWRWRRRRCRSLGLGRLDVPSIIVKATSGLACRRSGERCSFGI